MADRTQVPRAIREPSYLDAIIPLITILFTILGFRERVLIEGSRVVSELGRLDELFWITPLNLFPLLLLVALSIRKVPPSLAILFSAIFGGVLAIILQPQAILRFVNEPSLPAPLAYVKGIWSALATGYRANSGIPEIDTFLSRGGMSSMLKTLWIVIGAITLGTLLEEFNLIIKLVNPILMRARTTGRLMATVVVTAFGLNVVTADQYIAVVLPARLFRAEFRKRGLKGQNLSRACADAGTVTSPLVPWNSYGAYMAVTLGVPTMLYLPFCFFNIAAPFMSLFWGFTGLKIERLEPSEAPVEPVPQA